MSKPKDRGANRLSDAVLIEHHVLVRTDNTFQRRARLLQALWREARGFAIGERSPGVPLGSRISSDFGNQTGANLMTPSAASAARREVAAMRAGSGQKIEEDRLWANLLSSQPLAFTLFADLADDLDVATRVLRRVWPNRIADVTRIAFEYSPGRGLAKFTADRTAFDVYIEHSTPSRGRGFIGIEVKYHESLTDQPARHRSRYDEVTRAMRCFKPERLGALRMKPVEQLWRDHMLAGSMLLDHSAAWETGLYSVLYPEGNAACQRAVVLYKDHLADARTFDAVTLETFVSALEAEARWPWIHEVRDRYLDWTKIPL